MCCPGGTWGFARPSARRMVWPSCPSRPKWKRWRCGGGPTAPWQVGTCGAAWSPTRTCERFGNAMVYNALRILRPQDGFRLGRENLGDISYARDKSDASGGNPDGWLPAMHFGDLRQARVCQEGEAILHVLPREDGCEGPERHRQVLQRCRSLAGQLQGAREEVKPACGAAWQAARRLTTGATGGLPTPPRLPSVPT